MAKSTFTHTHPIFECSWLSVFEKAYANLIKICTSKMHHAMHADKKHVNPAKGLSINDVMALDGIKDFSTTAQKL